MCAAFVRNEYAIFAWLDGYVPLNFPIQIFKTRDQQTCSYGIDCSVVNYVSNLLIWHQTVKILYF